MAENQTSIEEGHQEHQETAQKGQQEHQGSSTLQQALKTSTPASAATIIKSMSSSGATISGNSNATPIKSRNVTLKGNGPFIGNRAAGTVNNMISPDNNSSKHHHHHHHHHHHSHPHHHSNSHHIIHRTTSESLRLGADMNQSGCNNNSSGNTGGSGGSNTPSSITGNSSSNATGTNSSNSSRQCNSIPFHLSNNTGASGGGGGNTGHQHQHQHPHPLSTSTSSSSIAIPAGAGGLVSTSRKPKTSSFQITSVTVGNKLSADNGEDSADDLDESHTDDNSRITDFENETPSVSEDTFSKEDVFFSSNALGTAPVIPTSSQYGLVIVDPDLNGVGGASGQTLSNVHVSVTDAGINIVGPGGAKLNDAEQKELQHRNERFKVVKIESTEPFKRGRWMCMDYLDHTTLQQTQNNSDKVESSSTPSTVTTGTVTTVDSGVVTENHLESSGGESSDINYQRTYNTTNFSPGQTLQNPLNLNSTTINEQQSQQQQQQQPQQFPQQISAQAQTISHVPNAIHQGGIPQQQNVTVGTAQSLPPTQIQQMISGQQMTSQNVNAQPLGDIQQSNVNMQQGQSQPAHFYVNSPQQQQQMPQAMGQTGYVHGTTLPSNIQVQNGVPTSLPSQQQQSVSQAQTMPAVNISMPVLPPQDHQSQMQQQPILPQSQMMPQTVPQQMLQSSVLPPQQGANVILQSQQGQDFQPQQIHSAPQTQIGLNTEMYVPQSVPQTYAAPPVSTSTAPTQANTFIVNQQTPLQSQQQQQQQPQPQQQQQPQQFSQSSDVITTSMPQQVISTQPGIIRPGEIISPANPASGVTMQPSMMATIDQQQQILQQQPAPSQTTQQIQQHSAPASTVAGISTVISQQQQPFDATSQQSSQQTQQQSQPNVATIGDHTAIVATIQAQQQVTPAAPTAPSAPSTLQTQQSIVATDDSSQHQQQQPAVETDTESVSSLALALSNSKKRASIKTIPLLPSFSFSITDSKIINETTAADSANVNRFPERATLTDSRTEIFSADHDLKRTNSMENKKNETNLPSNNIPTIPPAKATNLNILNRCNSVSGNGGDARGVPIPISPLNISNRLRMDSSAMVASRGVDGEISMAHSVSPTVGSPFFSGSPSPIGTPNQIAFSYDHNLATNYAATNLKSIGKTNSIPPGFSYASLSAAGNNASGSGGSGSRRNLLQQQRQFSLLQQNSNVAGSPSLSSTPTAAATVAENSASGTSAVAIDNKIEQAMDLVKSHLMIAVREEVEVLKEKIAELMDRINQLELENTILKANVSQETLSQLTATIQTAATAAGTTTSPAATTTTGSQQTATAAGTAAPTTTSKPPQAQQQQQQTSQAAPQSTQQTQQQPPTQQATQQQQAQVQQTQIQPPQQPQPQLQNTAANGPVS